MSTHDSILRGLARSHPSQANPFLVADMAQDRLGRAPLVQNGCFGSCALTRLGRSPVETRFVKKSMVSGST
jgi:hypothetical protein